MTTPVRSSLIGAKIKYLSNKHKIPVYAFVEDVAASGDMGVDIVGGIPHFERTMEDGKESIRLLCELAETRGLTARGLSVIFISHKLKEVLSPDSQK